MQVIYSASRKLLYSNVNLREATHICSFNCASFPDSLAVASDNKLTIGIVSPLHSPHANEDSFFKRLLPPLQARLTTFRSSIFAQCPLGNSPGELLTKQRPRHLQ